VGTLTRLDFKVGKVGMERIDTINQRLVDYFGQDTESNRAIWRVTWSDFQTEKRLIYYTKEGLELLTPEVREVSKYPYIKSRWILERLVLVPITDQTELPASKISYEPMWVFENNKNEPLQPKWEAIEHIIDCIYTAIGKHNSRAKYKDPDSGLTTKDLVEKERARIKRIQEDLFGNETEVTDALNVKDAIVVPESYTKINAKKVN